MTEYGLPAAEGVAFCFEPYSPLSDLYGFGMEEAVFGRDRGDVTTLTDDLRTRSHYAAFLLAAELGPRELCRWVERFYPLSDAERNSAGTVPMRDGDGEVRYFHYKTRPGAFPHVRAACARTVTDGVMLALVLRDSLEPGTADVHLWAVDVERPDGSSGSVRLSLDSVGGEWHLTLRAGLDVCRCRVSDNWTEKLTRSRSFRPAARRSRPSVADLELERLLLDDSDDEASS